MSVVRPTRVYLLDFFCSGIQLYILLSPYLCFVSFLYHDLYLLGDDTLISQGSFMQTKHLHVFVLIHIRNKGEVGTIHVTSLSPPVIKTLFTDRSKAVLLLWILFVIFVSCLSCCPVCSLQPFGHLLGKGLTAWLSCM